MSHVPRKRNAQTLPNRAGENEVAAYARGSTEALAPVGDLAINKPGLTETNGGQ